ncbi:cell wall metabolism sensor histidine kinase WalK [Streptomyces sp. FH025]|uniref:sensor histidine kinase n=1 Tax=Streptomyces sp. FH025 TaxID=2815937 RepID=UPI001A9F2CA5|nr:HAMP domain-containing sensor histidine kinase [Streptomyces sp. FH025]MBO1418680.1 HAMP domain-containing histidine kinase [Streptomyces sp. FH025]
MPRKLLPRTLRARLIAGLLVLLVATCAAVGFATTGALRHFLVGRLDQQLTEAGGRYAASLEHTGQGASPDTRAQTPGTLGVRLLDGTVTAAGVVDGDADDLSGPDDEDDRVGFPSARQRALAALPVGGPARSLDLGGTLGRYRVRAVAGRDGDVLVSGLPLRPAEETVDRLETLELTVFAVVVAVAGAAGAVWVGWSLRPLRRVVGMAERVSALPLASGAVMLAERVPDDDPRTEVGRVGAALNRMLGHVGDALARRHTVEERLRAFAADASHELRTPVAAVRGHAELALRHPGEVPGPVRHSLERIDAEAVRMGAIVEDLLLLARLDAGRPLAEEEVDLTRIALNAVTDARAAGPDHRWRLALPEEPVLVRGDEHRLSQVVANLLANARTHTPSGTGVELRLEHAGERVELSVVDDGPGIAPELLGRVFERFVRGDRARSRATGSTGLGLAIVEAVVQAHGGTVEAASRPGRTVFTVRLPGAA